MQEVEMVKQDSMSTVTVACVSGSSCSGTSTLVRRFVGAERGGGDGGGEGEAAAAAAAAALGQERCYGARLHRKSFVVATESGTQELRFMVWDVSGMIRSPQYYKLYTRGCRITMVIADLSSATSLHGARLVVETLKLSPDCPRLVLVGCKSDIALESVTQSAANFAAENGILFCITCALQSQRSVQSLFFKAAKENQSVRKPPKWVDDKLRPNCKLCARPFTLTLRRHHCRACSDIFCERCSTGKRALPHFGFNTPVRCCDTCIQVLGTVDADN